MNGYPISFLSEKTGISVGKLKMLLNRHPKLQAMPYSVKAGGARVFFDDFVVWLKAYEGVTEVESYQKSQKSQGRDSGVRLPNGAQMTNIRLMAEKGILTRDQVAVALGLPLRPQPAIAAPKEPPATSEQLDALMDDLRRQMSATRTVATAVARKAERRVIDAQEALIIHQLNYKLGFNGGTN